MVATAEKYQGIPDCSAGPRFAYSSWPVASHNEQRSSTNDQLEGRIVDAVVSLCRGGENIHYIPVVQSSESTYNFVSSRLRGEPVVGSRLPPRTSASVSRQHPPAQLHHGLLATAIIDRASGGKRPTRRKRTSANPASRSNIPSVRTDHNFM